MMKQYENEYIGINEEPSNLEIYFVMILNLNFKWRFDFVKLKVYRSDNDVQSTNYKSVQQYDK